MKRPHTIHHEGMSSRTKDGFHVTMLDYDYQKMPLKQFQFMLDDITLLQDIVGLGDVYLFSTKNGHHAIALEKHDVTTTYLIKSRSASDLGHTHVPIYGVSKQWVLRTTKKQGETMRYIGVLRSNTIVRGERSRAHANKLWKHAHVPEEDLRCRTGQWFDNENTITTATYAIRKRDN